jgi:hypothetical protein
MIYKAVSDKEITPAQITRCQDLAELNSYGINLFLALTYAVGWLK